MERSKTLAAVCEQAGEDTRQEISLVQKVSMKTEQYPVGMVSSVTKQHIRLDGAQTKSKRGMPKRIRRAAVLRRIEESLSMKPITVDWSSAVEVQAQAWQRSVGKTSRGRLCEPGLR